MGDVQVLGPREVPLGGVRSLEVWRTLPHRDRAFVGAWCFVDHYGPTTERMDVAPHPHTGLQTVSWLFSGEVEHRDSGGVVATVRPGEINLMSAGAGVAHSEVSTRGATSLHGVQLWVALPETHRHRPRSFQHHHPAVRRVAPGVEALVFVGSLAGVDSSPIETATPLLGAELRLAPGAAVDLAVDPAHEHAVLVDTGEVRLHGQPLRRGDLGCVDAGPAELSLVNGDAPARVVLLGGEPFDEDIVMWWNFVARTHDEIVEARAQYEAGSDRFGQVPGYVGEVARIPAPPIPGVRLRPRVRRGRR